MKSLFIVVNPVASKFGKAIQQALLSKVRNKVWRVDHQRRRGHHFVVTPQPLNKIQQLTLFKQHNVSCPEFTTDKRTIAEFGESTWFARTLINATNGRGIVEFDYPSERGIPDAPLYTRYIPKRAEYRVHVFGGRVIDVQQKLKRRGFEGERDTRVRNQANGYVYARDGITDDPRLRELAINAVNALGYNYGAVDVIYNEKRDVYYVLEVNSRPGLMGTTLTKYTEAITNMFGLELQ